jgi:choline dehydrogenase-like flavoprotein
MGTSPESSVVDSNLRYHHYKNLFLLGQGVMPTGGVVSPTVTLAGLALRCAKFIKLQRASVLLILPSRISRSADPGR